MYWLSRNLGSSNSWNPQGLKYDCTGIHLTFTLEDVKSTYRYWDHIRVCYSTLFGAAWVFDRREYMGRVQSRHWWITCRWIGEHGKLKGNSPIQDWIAAAPRRIVTESHKRDISRPQHDSRQSCVWISMHCASLLFHLTFMNQ